MRSLRSRAARTAAVLVAACAVGAGLGAATTPARAGTADVDQGAPLTRQLVVERALTWVDEGVAYGQSSWWPPTAPRTGAGHAYRQDCSGFVSMAWDLPTSAVTGDLVSATSPYDLPLASWDQLQPGDLLGVQGHVVLFLGWSDNDRGAHRWFDIASESTSGTVASVQRGQDRQGYWASYAPYRSKAVLADAPQSVSWGGGRVDQFLLDAAGHVQHRTSTTDVAGTPVWTTQDMTAAYGFATLRTGLTATSTGTGRLTVLGLGRDGRLVSWDLVGSTWTQREYASPAAVTGLAAAGDPVTRRVDLVARQHAAGDVDGTLVRATWTSAGLSAWSAVPGAPVVVDDPAVARTATGLAVVAEDRTGALQLGRCTTSCTSWTWAAATGSTRVAARPALAALADGTLVILATGGGTLQADVLAPGATTWSGFVPVPGVPAAGGAPGWASSAALPTADARAPLDVFVTTTAGAVVTAVRSSAGRWSYLGAAAPPPGDGATARTVRRTLNRP